MKKFAKVLISLIVVGLLCVVAYPAVSEIFGLDSALINKSGTIVALGDFGEVARRKYGICRGADAYSEGLGSVEQSKLWGFVDKKGQFVFQKKFANALPFSEGLAAVFDGRKWGFINHQGDYVIAPSFDQVLPFREGLAAVACGIRVGYINRDGKFVVQPKYQSGSSFFDGLARVDSFDENDNENTVYFINDVGEPVLNLTQIERMFHVTEVYYGDADNELYPPTPISLISGREFYNRSFSTSEPVNRHLFHDGLLLVGVGTKCGYLDKTGRISILPKFDFALQFREGLAVVGLKNNENQMRYGYINSKGEIAIPLTFQVARDFHDGVAFVQFPNGKLTSRP